MLNRVCLALAFALAVATGPALADALVKAGQSAFVIVVPNDPIPAELTAASELRDHLAAMTGAELPILEEAKLEADAPRVLIGPSNLAKALLTDVPWNELAADEMLIRTVDGETLVLAGGRPRGTLYAVYSFLEDHLGVRWWTTITTDIPRRDTIDLPRLDVRYEPPFWYRSAYYWQMNRIPEEERARLERKRAFAARLKLNGQHCQVAEKHGGRHTFAAPAGHSGFVHTFFYLLPPSVYYAAHPEWFTGDPAVLRTARGHVSNAQLCLTNPEVIEEAKARALEVLAADPNADLLSVSQNDGTGGFCTCDSCTALAEREGSHAGPIIHFVNTIAEAVEAVRPDVMVETLAYTYSVDPPTRVRPRPNVMVRLCSYHAAGAWPLDHERNAVYRDQLLGWSRIASSLFVWNYHTNFRDQYLPHPNHGVFAPDLRFFRGNHVVGVFQQASQRTAVADFSELKLWVQAHLLWDPDRDVDALIDEFLAGYYGPAAPFLRQYVDMSHRAVRRAGVALACDNNDLSFIDHDFLVRGKRAFDAAEKAVGDDDELLRRVRRARVCFDYGRLVRAPAVLQRQALVTGQTQTPERNPRDALDALMRRLRRLDESQYYERATTQRNIALMRALFRPEWPPATRPPGVTGKPFVDWYDAQETVFRFNRFGKNSFLSDDPAASNGQAGWVPGESPVWAIQWHFPADALRFAPVARCRIAVRCEAPAGTTATFNAGIYDVPRRRTVCGKVWHVAAGDANDYRLYDLGTHRISPGMYLWVAGVPGSGTSRIFVDRMVLTPER